MTDEKKKREDGEVTDEQLQNVAGGKISAGQPNDLAEREADEVADEVIGDKKEVH